MKKVYLYLIAFVWTVTLVAAPVIYAAGVSEGLIAQGIAKINAGQYSEALELLEKETIMLDDIDRIITEHEEQEAVAAGTSDSDQSSGEAAQQ